MVQVLHDPSEIYTIVLQPEPEGGFTVTCPALPEVITYGDTVEEAREQAKEAIEALLESSAKQGETLPAGDGGALAPRHEQLRVRLPA